MKRIFSYTTSFLLVGMMCLPHLGAATIPEFKNILYTDPPGPDELALLNALRDENYNRETTVLGPEELRAMAEDQLARHLVVPQEITFEDESPDTNPDTGFLLKAMIGSIFGIFLVVICHCTHSCLRKRQ